MDEGSFKCYMADTGLLVAQLFADSEQTPHEVYRDILLGKLEKFKAKFGGRVGTQYVLHPKPMSDEGDLVRLPLYMAHLL